MEPKSLLKAPLIRNQSSFWLICVLFIHLFIWLLLRDTDTVVISLAHWTRRVERTLDADGVRRSQRMGAVGEDGRRWVGRRKRRRRPGRGGSGRRRRRHLQLQFLPLFLLHPSILEPDLHLRFVERQRGGDLDAPGSGQVTIEVKFLLQLGQLFIGEVGAAEVGRRRRRMKRMLQALAEAAERHLTPVVRVELVSQISLQLSSSCARNTHTHTHTHNLLQLFSVRFSMQRAFKILRRTEYRMFQKWHTFCTP